MVLGFCSWGCSSRQTAPERRRETVRPGLASLCILQPLDTEHTLTGPALAPDCSRCIQECGTNGAHWQGQPRNRWSQGRRSAVEAVHQARRTKRLFETTSAAHYPLRYGQTLGQGASLAQRSCYKASDDEMRVYLGWVAKDHLSQRQHSPARSVDDQLRRRVWFFFSSLTSR